MSIISPRFASFFIITSSTITSDFIAISLEYLCRMWFGTALCSGTKSSMYSVRILLTSTTKFDCTATQFGNVSTTTQMSCRSSASSHQHTIHGEEFSMMVTTNVMNTFLLVHIVTTNLEQDVIRNPSQRDCVSLADFINQGDVCRLLISSIRVRVAV